MSLHVLILRYIYIFSALHFLTSCYPRKLQDAIGCILFGRKVADQMGMAYQKSHQELCSIRVPL